ncbi:hypothetical protein GCM10009001_29640 [Virgibacillus siamensis]|uniref:Uncharacterized protein n=1 Tax=Virgibacillus siamensis TaxID=480071 RepID=A0ABP3RJ10_9BACI
MKLQKPDEMERSHNLKSARNAFMFYIAALIIWAIYDFITTGKAGLQMTILLVGTAVFWWSRSILNKQTEEEKVKIPPRAIIWTIFYLVIFLAIIFIANYYS